MWRWGALTEKYGYDRAGRLSEIRYADDTSTVYAFKDMFSSLVSIRVHATSSIRTAPLRKSRLVSAPTINEICRVRFSAVEGDHAQGQRLSVGVR